MNTELILKTLQQIMNRRKPGVFMLSNDIGVDSLALAVKMGVTDLLVELQVLQAEGKVELMPHITTKKVKSSIWAGRVKLAG